MASPRHPWSRFVALGDSFTEGIGDPDPDSPGGHRGWADRVAEELARDHPDFAYANLAVRGRLLQIIDEQVPPAVELTPDLISFCAGNDIIRPGADPDALAEKIDAAIETLSAAGATLVLFTVPDVGDTPLIGSVRARAAIYNENLRTVAARHYAVIADMWTLRQLKDPRMWAPDRLHFSPLGHHTIAAMVLDTLNVEHTLQPETPIRCRRRTGAQPAPKTVWARQHLVPWVLRALRHRSLGDGIYPKRPMPGPVLPGHAARHLQLRPAGTAPVTRQSIGVP